MRQNCVHYSGAFTLLIHYDAVNNLRTHFAIISIIYIFVYFPVPCTVVDLFLTPGPHSILLNWK